MCSQRTRVYSFCSGELDDWHWIGPLLKKPWLHGPSHSSSVACHWHSTKLERILQKTDAACRTILTCSNSDKLPCCDDEERFLVTTRNPLRRPFLWLSSRSNRRTRRLLNCSNFVRALHQMRSRWN